MALQLRLNEMTGDATFHATGYFLV